MRRRLLEAGIRHLEIEPLLIGQEVKVHRLRSAQIRTDFHIYFWLLMRFKDLLSPDCQIRRLWSGFGNPDRAKIGAPQNPY